MHMLQVLHQPRETMVDGIHPASPPTKVIAIPWVSVINRRIGSACENFAQWRRCGASGSSSGELQVHPSPGFDITRRVLPPTTLGRGADGLGLMARIVKTGESAECLFLFFFRNFCFCNLIL